MNRFPYRYFCALLISSYLSSISFSTTIHTIFGDIDSSDPILHNLLASQTMERLKDIDQGGPCVHFGHAPTFLRFDHCVGVWALLKRFDASLPEQVAGLLHDASHTAFSHVADTFFNGGETGEHSYQDSIHLKYLSSQEDVMAIFLQYSFSLDDANSDLPLYNRLEQPLPDICADRLEYNLHTAILYGKLSGAEVNEILQHVKFEGEHWYFTDIGAALRFSSLPLDFNQTVWGVPWNMVLYDYFVDLLKKAIAINVIALEDFRNGLDSQIMEKLRQSENVDIKASLKLCENVKSSFDIIEEEAPFDKKYLPKFRGIDPWVMSDSKLVRLTELSPTFKEEYNAIKNWCIKGFKVKFKPIA
jgi:HD superfamily phosphohydrolase